MPEDTLAEVQEHHLPGRTPLFLIHDGGGTIFSYYLLNDLDRAVYGISNPHFDNDEGQQSCSMRELAILYVDFIRRAYPAGNILLGGWSLGGMLSLEMARILADDEKLRVKGMLFIDSPYPKSPLPDNKDGLGLVAAAFPAPVFSSSTRRDVRDKITRCMEHARRIIADWELPEWNAARPLPPTVLFRSRARVHDLATGRVAPVDFARDDAHLGWDSYDSGFIKRAEEIAGSHYEVFKLDCLDDVSDKIKAACDFLDATNTTR